MPELVILLSLTVVCLSGELQWLASLGSIGEGRESAECPEDPMTLSIDRMTATGFICHTVPPLYRALWKHHAKLVCEPAPCWSCCRVRCRIPLPNASGVQVLPDKFLSVELLPQTEIEFVWSGCFEFRSSSGQGSVQLTAKCAITRDGGWKVHSIVTAKDEICMFFQSGGLRSPVDAQSQSSTPSMSVCLQLCGGEAHCNHAMWSAICEEVMQSRVLYPELSFSATSPLLPAGEAASAGGMSCVVKSLHFDASALFDIVKKRIGSVRGVTVSGCVVRFRSTLQEVRSSSGSSGDAQVVRLIEVPYEGTCPKHCAECCICVDSAALQSATTVEGCAYPELFCAPALKSASCGALAERRMWRRSHVELVCMCVPMLVAASSLLHLAEPLSQEEGEALVKEGCDAMVARGWKAAVDRT